MFLLTCLHRKLLIKFIIAKKIHLILVFYKKNKRGQRTVRFNPQSKIYGPRQKLVQKKL